MSKTTSDAADEVRIAALEAAKEMLRHAREAYTSYPLATQDALMFLVDFNEIILLAVCGHFNEARAKIRGRK